MEDSQSSGLIDALVIEWEGLAAEEAQIVKEVYERETQYYEGVAQRGGGILKDLDTLLGLQRKKPMGPRNSANLAAGVTHGAYWKHLMVSRTSLVTPNMPRGVARGSTTNHRPPLVIEPWERVFSLSFAESTEQPPVGANPKPTAHTSLMRILSEKRQQDGPATTLTRN